MTKDLQTQNDETADAASRDQATEMTLEEREVQLKKKEAELAAKETELEEKKASLRFRYKLYDRINVSVRTMNIVIIVLVVILLLIVAYGIYDARF